MEDCFSPCAFCDAHRLTVDMNRVAFRFAFLYFGLAIGFTVTAGMYAVGPVSIGVFNPAVAVGIAILGVTLQINLWIYVAASLAAAIVAAISFKLINSGNQTDTS